jgi:hypothetical protein
MTRQELRDACTARGINYTTAEKIDDLVVNLAAYYGVATKDQSKKALRTTIEAKIAEENALNSGNADSNHKEGGALDFELPPAETTPEDTIDASTIDSATEDAPEAGSAPDSTTTLEVDQPPLEIEGEKENSEEEEITDNADQAEVEKTFTAHGDAGAEDKDVVNIGLSCLGMIEKPHMNRPYTGQQINNLIQRETYPFTAELVVANGVGLAYFVATSKSSSKQYRFPEQGSFTMG